MFSYLILILLSWLVFIVNTIVHELYFIPAKQLYNKFLKWKPNMGWKEHPIPLEYFTEDAALLLSDIDILALEEEYDLHCEIFINPGKYFKGSTSGFAFPKNSPLKEMINYHLLKFIQSGLLEQLIKKYFKEKRHVCEPPVRELDFKATIFSFAILVIGVVTSLVVSLVEKIRSHLQTRK